ncbi:MAG: hypothetical protein DMG47_20020 [Acidobacteria bacterium]|nr:MAG: hypothetical protein DMG47_20020 [Acidobacteriota bacterium]PYT59200.1 MAG: hypothetical protein DMG46_10095 [Acidobacteriota bacterium]
MLGQNLHCQILCQLHNPVERKLARSKFETTSITVFDETNPVPLRYSILKSSELAQCLLKFC